MNHRSLIFAFSVALLLGCSDRRNGSERSPQLKPPTDAQTLMTGRGEIMLRAPGDGRVWLVDQATDRVLLRRRVRAGQRFGVSMKHQNVTLDDAVIAHRELIADHTFQILFEPEKE